MEVFLFIINIILNLYTAQDIGCISWYSRYLYFVRNITPSYFNLFIRATSSTTIHHSSFIAAVHGLRHNSSNDHLFIKRQIIKLQLIDYDNTTKDFSRGVPAAQGKPKYKAPPRKKGLQVFFCVPLALRSLGQAPPLSLRFLHFFHSPHSSYAYGLHQRDLSSNRFFFSKNFTTFCLNVLFYREI